MRVAIGADHRGFPLKESVKKRLEASGVAVIDFGANSDAPADYPDYGRPVAEAVAEGKADLGITVCWTGNGMNMVANKVSGVRAAMALNPEMARLARAHNDANVLSLAAKYTPDPDAMSIVNEFLKTQFEGGRHQKRLDKMDAIQPAQARP
ncbi:MAG: ribose 5-phosphate isomerase B [candidate division Zixibacteria bacterium]|nr:ribose 5-phosphate isomerase B [candidate division Zixibacteria bacterium]